MGGLPHPGSFQAQGLLVPHLSPQTRAVVPRRQAGREVCNAFDIRLAHLANPLFQISRIIILSCLKQDFLGHMLIMLKKNAIVFWNKSKRALSSGLSSPLLLVHRSVNAFFLRSAQSNLPGWGPWGCLRQMVRKIKIGNGEKNTGRKNDI